MKTKKEKILTCYNLLKNILSEAFQTEVHYFTPPYADLSVIDSGIRNLFWPGFENKNQYIRSPKDSFDQLFYVIRSNLGFYNIIFYLNTNAEPDFFSIGPFRSDEFSLDYIKSMLTNAKLSSAQITQLEHYYETIPYVSFQQIYNVSTQIIFTFMPDLKHQKPVHLEFSNSDHKIEIDNQQANTFDADSAIAYQQELLKLFDSLIHGEVEASQIQMTKMINSLKLFSSRNVALNQHNLITLNGQCALVLLNTNIHPVHIFKLHRALRAKIMKANTREIILNTASEMCRKYCLLVQNYAFTEYSKTVREVVNYINTHFEDDLNLSNIAQVFQKNASSLSASFSKEVGMSLTNYIHQTRINEAIRLFNSTEQSVSEVALAVGFHDFAYFSRLFHKQVGCSPREYCKKIR